MTLSLAVTYDSLAHSSIGTQSRCITLISILICYALFSNLLHAYKASSGCAAQLGSQVTSRLSSFLRTLYFDLALAQLANHKEELLRRKTS